MQKWEYKTIYVAITPDFKFITKLGPEFISDNKVWEYINTLGQDGWELVTVSERIGNEPPPNVPFKLTALFGGMMMGQDAITVTQHKAVTLGYFYHFKREKLPNTQPLNPKSL